MTPRDAFALLKDAGYLEYGASLPAKVLRQAFGIPEIRYPAMRQEIKEQELAELSASDYLRNKLLNEGKYLKGVADGYRILLPHENAAQVLSYMESADRKLKRALKLNANTPPAHKIRSNDEVRAIMKRESIRQKKAAP